MAKNKPESRVLRACLDYLRLRGHFVFRVNCGAFKTDRGGYFKSTDIPGVSDIIGIAKDGRGLAVECKSDKGKLSELQKAFGEKYREAGGVFIVARSVEDLQEAGL